MPSRRGLVISDEQMKLIEAVLVKGGHLNTDRPKADTTSETSFEEKAPP